MNLDSMRKCCTEGGDVGFVEGGEDGIDVGGVVGSLEGENVGLPEKSHENCDL